MTDAKSHTYALRVLENPADHRFSVPKKCINDGDDVTFFLTSRAYTDIMTFVFQLNAAMFPRKNEDDTTDRESSKRWILQDQGVTRPKVAQDLAKLLENLSMIIEEAPPDPGPRRFGNISFRRWYEIVRERISSLLDQYLPSDILSPRSDTHVSAKEELEAYLLGSFGSSQRLDYGTGHELSFLAFLGCLWKLGAFPGSQNGDIERAIVLEVIEPYLQLIRRLILTYTLEPAGSHGVWGLDDHSFLPYIFGSAQLSPAISSASEIVTEGSFPDAPHPTDVAKANVVEKERRNNMYFSAIGFIYDVKKGPFWEHSPILFDISGVKAGWAKINKGMLKMYNAEVLSKFPVVQHFPFGSLFVWEKDPEAAELAKNVHTASQPRSTVTTARPQAPLRDPVVEQATQSTRAPWAASNTVTPGSGTAAPWASSRVPMRTVASVPTGPNQPIRAPWTPTTALPPPSGNMATGAWADSGGTTGTAKTQGGAPSTRAPRTPWADEKPRD